VIRVLARCAVVMAVAAACAGAAPSVAVTPARAAGESRTFLDKSFALLRRITAGATSLNARITITQRAAGMQRPVSADCRVEFRAPGMLVKEVREPHAYTVTVSNGMVTSEFPATHECDTRRLAEGEDVLADFLGITAFPDPEPFDLDFAVEGSLYVVKAVMRPQVQEALARDLIRNARVAVRRTIWLNADQGRIVRTFRATLAHDEETCEFRSFWLNLEPQSAGGRQ